MALDPLSALGVVANVLQVLQFGTKVISKSRDLRNSTAGILLEHHELMLHNERIIALRSELERSQRKAFGQRQLSGVEQALADVAEECKNTADRFQAILADYVAGSGATQWKSLRKAFKAVWGKEGVEQMKGRLQTQQLQVVVHLLLALSDREIDTLRTANQNQENMIALIQSSTSEMRKDISKLAAQYQQSDISGDHFKIAAERKLLQDRYQGSLNSLITDFDSVINPSDKQVTEYLLSTLYFVQMRDRDTQIQPAHEKTLKWMFDKSDARYTPTSNLAAWLEGGTDSSLFWIAGKPGSGKSTLMHMFFHAPETERALRIWSKDGELLSAVTYGWLAGSEKQKTLQGLLRSLLHDLLSGAEPLVAGTMSGRWRAAAFGSFQQPDWTVGELIATLRHLLEVSRGEYMLCLFIDGLDEYEATDNERRELIALLKDCSSYPHVRVCVSSREWPIFQTAFENDPQLWLENLTREDIRAFVEAELAAESEFQSLQRANNKACQEIVTEVLDKARGVFLWVSLVVRSLILGVINGDSIFDLRERLNALPDELDQLFMRILTNIPCEYREQAALYFAAVTEAPVQPKVMLMSFIEKQRPVRNLLRDIPFEPFSLQQIDVQKKSMIRRLGSRCGGMLEALKLPRLHIHAFLDVKPWCDYPKRNTPDALYWEAFFDLEVIYLHRTVKDFLMSRTAQKILVGYMGGATDIHVVLAEAALLQMKIVDSQSPVLWEVIETYAALMDIHQPCPNNDLHDEFTTLVNDHLAPGKDCTIQSVRVGCEILIALWAGLEKRTIHLIANAPQEIILQKHTHPVLEREDEVPLLWIALMGPTCLSKVDGPSSGARRSQEVVNALLRRGVDVTQLVRDGEDLSSIFDQFLRQSRLDPRHDDHPNLTIARMLISHVRSTISNEPCNQETMAEAVTFDDVEWCRRRLGSLAAEQMAAIISSREAIRNQQELKAQSPTPPREHELKPQRPITFRRVAKRLFKKT